MEIGQFWDEDWSRRNQAGSRLLSATEAVYAWPTVAGRPRDRGPLAPTSMRAPQDRGPPLGTRPENPFRFVLAKPQEIRHFFPDISFGYFALAANIALRYIAPVWRAALGLKGLKQAGVRG